MSVPFQMNGARANFAKQQPEWPKFQHFNGFRNSIGKALTPFRLSCKSKLIKREFVSIMIVYFFHMLSFNLSPLTPVVGPILYVVTKC